MRPAHGGPDRVYSVLETDGAREPIEEEISASWRRSLAEHHLDPESLEAPHILTTRELKDVQAPVEGLVAIAREESDRLHAIVGKVGYVVLLTSPQGVVVDARGDPHRTREFAYWGVWKGGVWSENAEGTNGIGTCIAEQGPVTVHRTQHFRARNADLSCCGAPVFDPEGTFAGVLDVSSVDPGVSDRSHAMAMSVTMNSARAIEEKWFRGNFASAWILTFASLVAETFQLALDDDQRIVGADWNARATLGIDSGLISAGVSLWTYFERSLSGFHASAFDTEAHLTRLGHKHPWRVLVTAPRRFADHAAPALRAQAPHQSAPAHDPGAGVSPRERNILDLIGQGRSNKEIARILGISPETVKSHIKNVFKKLEVERRAEAVVQARARGFLAMR
jgi:transcriptional regulator of acetoin/glycerol metabolism